MKHDVIVIGAGPGGSATATFLAKKNLNVLLLDKATFPRNKTCGDGLTPRGVSVIERLGAIKQVSSAAQRINYAKVIAPNGRSITTAIQQATLDDAHMLAIPRYELDSILVQNAVSAGAELQEDCNVTDISDESDGVIVHGVVQGEICEYSAKYAVIATGASLRLLKKSGFLEGVQKPIIAARAYYENANHPDDYFNFHFNEVKLPGYGWIFPLPNNKVNVGVGLVPKKRDKAVNIKSLYEDFSNRPYMKKVLTGAKQLGDVQSYPIRTNFLTSRIFKHRTLVVGEAGGLTNPLTGEGLDYAMESGEIAAKHLLDIITRDDDPRALKSYEIALKEQYTPIFNFSNQIIKCCLNPFMLNTMIRVAARKDNLSRSLTNIVLGLKEPPANITLVAVLKKIFQ